MIGEKGTPWHFWGDKGNWVDWSTQKVPLSKTNKFAVTPLVLTHLSLSDSPPAALTNEIGAPNAN